MLIDKNTKIAALIKHNDESIDVIASINKLFNKLRNPVLRKILASRVSIAEASKIGGVQPEDMLKRLEKIGFEIALPTKASSEEEASDLASPRDEFEGKEIVELDVRPMLEEGIDPYNAIMKLIKTISENQILLLINTFEPIPLINIMKGKGFDYKTERPGTGIVHTYLFRKEPDLSAKKESIIIENDASLFDAKCELLKENLKEVDVRHLEMPLPMATILEEIENLNKGQGLFVYHKKFPQFLLEEIGNRGYSLISKTIDENNINLIIFK